MTRALFLVFFFVINCFAAWNGEKSVPQVVTAASGDIYQISSPAELAWFADQVNNGKTDLNAELTANILFDSDSTKYTTALWPIIGVAPENAYKGFFEGNGHTIYGMNIAIGNPFSYGLFGYLDTLGVIQNVSVAYSHISLNFEKWNKDSVNVGMLVGHTNGTIVNCHARKGNVQISDEYHRFAKGYVGGLVGNTGSGSLEKVSSSTEMNLDVFGDYYIGGIVGRITGKTTMTDAKNYADIHVKGDTTNTFLGENYTLKAYANNIGDRLENYVGGIVGYCQDGEVNSAENHGNIYMNFGIAGGIAGRGLELNDVVNYGSVSDTLGVAGGIGGLYAGGWNQVNQGKVFGYFAGGILGSGQPSDGAVNKGSVHGTMIAGGIVAWGAAQFAKNEGEVTGKIAGGVSGWLPRLYNFESTINASGKVKGDSITGALAGVAEGYIEHSYYDKDILPNVDCFGGTAEYIPSHIWCEALPTDTMKTIEFAGRLNEDDYFIYGKRIWSYVPGEYPDFRKEGYQEVFRIELDDGNFITSGYTDYKGKLSEMRIPISEEGHYFVGWVDSAGKLVDKNYVFKDSATLFAKYSTDIEDSSLVVYEQPSYIPDFKVWNGDFHKIDKLVRKGGRLYYAIYTAEELNWYLDYSTNLSGILMNDIVLGKDSLTPSEHEMFRWSFKRKGLCDTCVFDGNHHTIYGPRHALFKNIGTDSGGVVRDLKIRNALIERYGGAIAQTSVGQVINCSVQGLPLDTTTSFAGLVYNNDGLMDSVEFIFDFKPGDLKGDFYDVAGIASYNSYKATITNAHSYGSAHYSVGGNSTFAISGIVRSNNGMLRNARNEASFDIDAANIEMAGISILTSKYLINAVNTGDISGSSRGSKPRLAGIAAINDSIVDSCSNKGYLHLTYSAAPGNDTAALAGIVALNRRGSVKNVLNEGKVHMEDISRAGYYPNKFSVGGIVGVNWGKVDTTENRKPVLHECPNFYNECEYATDTKNATFAIGGIVGKNHNMVKNSKNLGRVAGFTNVGGIAGLSDSILTNVNNRGPVYAISVIYDYSAYLTYSAYDKATPHVGGIAGTCNSVEKAYNEAPIFYAYAFQKKYSYIAGVCGSLQGNLNQAFNIGDIVSEDNVDSSFVAGIVAELEPGASITNAFNWGNLTSRGFTAGVWAKGDSSVTVKNVYSTAKVDGLKSQAGVYAFVSNYEEDHAKNAFVYYDSAAVKDAYSVTFFVPMSSKQMKTDDFKNALNTTAGTEEDSKLWTRTVGYPVFAGFEMVPMSSYYEEGFSSSSVKSSSSVASSSSVESSSSEESSSSVVSSSSEESSSSIESSSSEETSSSSSKTAIPVVMKPVDFAIDVSGRTIMVHLDNEKSSYALMDLHGRVLKNGVLYKGNSWIEVTRSGNFILRVDGINRFVRIQ